MARNVLSIVWEKYNKVRITDLSENLMLVEFDSKENASTILDLNPWVVQGSYLSIKKWKPEMSITYIEFNSI